MKKIKISKLVISIIIPLAVGMLSAFITKNAMFVFDNIKKPLLSPPGILFPIVWSVLYVLMGISSYMIYQEKDNANVKNEVKNLLIIYLVQLMFNFFWSIIFFKFAMYKFAFMWLIILWVLVLLYIIKSYKVNRIASYLMIQYIVWMTFAEYLNIMIAILN